METSIYDFDNRLRYQDQYDIQGRKHGRSWVPMVDSLPCFISPEYAAKRCNEILTEGDYDEVRMECRVTGEVFFPHLAESKD